MLRAVHDAPAPPTRAAVTRQVGVGRGTATVLVADLKNRGLLTEADTEARSSGPGRPTAQLVPHPEGPVVVAVAISYDGWTMDVVEIGGSTLHSIESNHDRRRSSGALATIAKAVRSAATELPGRTRALTVSAPATIYRGRIAQASLMGWADVDALTPFADFGVPMMAVNDATAAGIGEARRGAARGQDVVLHIHADAGVGGALLINGRPAPDAHGAGGEFGHMPLGNGGDRRCHCGSRGCWDLDVGNLALAGIGREKPRPSIRRAAAEVLERARRGDSDAVAQTSAVSAALGRGVGALVNGADPGLVTVSGTAATLIELAPGAFQRAYLFALMRFRRKSPPPVVQSNLGGRGQRVGTAELAFDLLLTEALLRDPSMPA